MQRSYFQKASYLDKSFEKENSRLDLSEHHFLLSRNAKSLKVWMTLKVYGLKRLKDMIQKDIDLTEFLKNEIKKSEDFELVSDSPLAICCFRFNGGLNNEGEILIVSQFTLYGDISKDKNFCDSFSNWLNMIYERGVENTLKEYLK